MISQARVTFIRKVAAGFYENAFGLSVSMISNPKYTTSRADITLLFTAVNKVRCNRCPPRSNLLSNFCESDFGKQGLFNTTNKCAHHFLVWDILRLQFRDWKHIVIDRSNNGQLLLFAWGENRWTHCLCWKCFHLQIKESQLKLLLTNPPLNVLYCGALLSSELELLLRLVAIKPGFLLD